MMPDLRHKHWALIIIGLLVAAFALVTAYYFLGSDTVSGPVSQEATSTPVQATSTPATPVHITENATYYDIDLAYPSATPLVSVSADANDQAVTLMRATMQDLAAEFKKNGNFDNLTHDDVQMMRLDERKEALSSEYKTYTGARTVSYVFTVYEDTLGAHPNGYFRTFTFDTKTGQSLGITDLFIPSVDAATLLSAKARADLPAIIKQKSGYDADMDMITDGTAPKTDSFQDFYIDRKNLVILFPPYQVGPYALGPVTYPISLASLSASLKPEYR